MHHRQEIPRIANEMMNIKEGIINGTFVSDNEVKL